MEPRSKDLTFLNSNFLQLILAFSSWSLRKKTTTKTKVCQGLTFKETLNVYKGSDTRSLSI